MFAIQWFPTVIWTLLCIVGIYYGYREIKECKEDMSVVEKDKNSFKFIVASSNRSNAIRNMGIQFVFIGAAILTTYFKLQEPNPWSVDSEVSLVRAIFVPALFIFAEYLLISNLIEFSIMRRAIKKKVDERKEEKKKE